MNKMKEHWFGITYPKLFQFDIVLKIWKALFCPHGWHLLDECASIDDHDLYCDACELTIPIKGVLDEKYT